jgi:hypothetical protein
MTSVFPHPIAVESFEVICSILGDAIDDCRLGSQKLFEVFDMLKCKLRDVSLD